MVGVGSSRGGGIVHGFCGKDSTVHVGCGHFVVDLGNLCWGWRVEIDLGVVGFGQGFDDGSTGDEVGEVQLTIGQSVSTGHHRQASSLHTEVSRRDSA